MLRRTFKKGTDFSKITDAELQAVVDKINNMPRSILGWKSSNELFNLYTSLNF
ncbi:hypothetical protein [Mycoplasmopsis agassizii]|uniref:hypothetical protein n=1 Tax=Mycoplasmopsis agassizii TaxID=33922 RepID=UPI0015D99675|nr:hypothetical protein [Mycoplasmopsis agassizii]